jgi:hypothetical protein
VILTEARVEVELNLARQLSKFELRDIQKNFTANIKNAQTETEVTEIITQVQEEIAGFRTAVETQLNATLDTARNTEGLEDRVADAEAYADKIRNELEKDFDGKYAEGELQATARQTVLGFQTAMGTFKEKFDEKNTKDAVDELETMVKRSLSNSFNYRSN